MIALLLAAALHLTPPEQFFCEPHWPTLQQCIRKTREWLCRPDALRDTDEPDAPYVQTVRAERRLLCKPKARRALHMTGPERFFCDDLHKQTLQECIRRTRRWICSPEDVGDEIDTDALYAQTIREERRLVCRRHHRRLS